MKRLVTILAIGCIAAMSLTSCLSDDDDNNQGLTKDQISMCMTELRGDYSGKMVYLAKNPQNIYDTQDTIDISWSVTADTLLVFKSFPANIVAEQIYDTELKEALMEANPTKDLKCEIGFTYLDDNVEFLLAPIKVDYPVLYKDITRTLSVYFWFSATSFGYKSRKTGIMEGQLVMASAVLDNDESTNLIGTSPSSYANIPMMFSTSLIAAESR